MSQYETLGLDAERYMGFDFEHYDKTLLPKLPPEDEIKWYSKFYYRGRRELGWDKLKYVARGNTMDPAKAVLPGEYDKMLEPGLIQGDLGYCLLPDGTGYGSTHSILDDVSFEMYSWYKTLRMIDKLSYMIWYPGSHVTEVNGVSIEDVGFGNERVDVVSPATVKGLGFSCNPREKDPDFLGLIGGNTWFVNENNPAIKPRAMCLVHYIRKHSDEAIEFRTHIYMGTFLVDGKGEIMQRLSPELSLEAVRRMAEHCTYERENVSTFLPELYEKMKDIDLSSAEAINECWPIDKNA